MSEDEGRVARICKQCAWTKFTLRALKLTIWGVMGLKAPAVARRVLTRRNFITRIEIEGKFTVRRDRRIFEAYPLSHWRFICKSDPWACLIYACGAKLKITEKNLGVGFTAKERFTLLRFCPSFRELFVAVVLF